MQATRLMDAIKSLIVLVTNNTEFKSFPSQEQSFQTLPVPWTIAQLEDEEDPRVS